MSAAVYRGDVLDRDAPIGALAELVFLAPSGGDDDRGLLANALRALADEAEVLIEALRAKDSVAHDVVLRCLERIQQRSTFALELDQRRRVGVRTWFVRERCAPLGSSRRSSTHAWASAPADGGEFSRRAATPA